MITNFPGGSDIFMSRYERFRNARYERRRHAAVILIILILFLSGIFTVDYSLNNLIKDENRISILTYRRVGNSYTEFGIMNQKFCVNTEYISNDFLRLKMMLTKVFHF